LDIVFEKGQGDLLADFQGSFISLLGIHWRQLKIWWLSLTAYSTILKCIANNLCPLYVLRPLHVRYVFTVQTSVDIW